VVGRRDRRRQTILLGFAALVLIAAVALYVTAPPPTMLVIRVFDADTGAPLAGARVEAQQPGQLPMPAANTDETGMARLAHPRPDPGYAIRVQKPDYALGRKENVSVPESQETEVTVELVPQPGGRLFVGLAQARLAEIDTASLLVLRTVILPAAPDAPVRHLSLHPDEELLYAVAGAQAFVLRANGAVLAEFDTGGTVDSLDVSRDGEYLFLTGSAQGGASALIARRHLWILDARSGALVEDGLLLRGDWVASGGVVWRPDGSDADLLRLTSPVVEDLPAPGRRTLALSEVPTGATHNPTKVILSPDEETLYTWRQGFFSHDHGGFSDVLVLIATEDGSTVYEEMPPGISALALSPLGDELYALSAELGTLTIISLTGSRPQTVVPVGKEPQILTVSADGRWAYIGDGQEQAIVVVDLPSAAVWFTILLPREPLSLAGR
jgi:uncharacterized protein YceK